VEAFQSQCTLVSLVPTPGPAEVSLFPVPGEDDWIRGTDTATVTVTEYSDFECSYCALLAPVLDQLQQAFPEQVRVVFRHFPLTDLHPNAFLASQAAEAAGLQGKFWEMHDLLFAEQATWAPLDPAAFEDYLKEKSALIGLDPDRFAGDLAGAEVAGKVRTALENGQSIGLPGTPFLLFNGKVWQGPNDLASLSNLVQIILLETRQFTGCPPVVIDPQKDYTATLVTEKGDIVIELNPSKTPLAVNSFVFLAQNDWFDGVTFHRVVSDPNVAQAGDPSGTGWGGPGYAFPDEIWPELLFDQPGLVAMANSGPDTNGSQFFITKAAIPLLDGKFTIFGRVIQGMQVVDQLTPRDPTKAFALPPGDRILDVIIEERG
jgi:cyclophilin family peptidyl-prolyl cis-trans isomerase/protein-disulfide isomerase